MNLFMFNSNQHSVENVFKLAVERVLQYKSLLCNVIINLRNRYSGKFPSQSNEKQFIYDKYEHLLTNIQSRYKNITSHLNYNVVSPFVWGSPTNSLVSEILQKSNTHNIKNIHLKAWSYYICSQSAWTSFSECIQSMYHLNLGVPHKKEIPWEIHF